MGGTSLAMVQAKKLQATTCAAAARTGCNKMDWKLDAITCGAWGWPVSSWQEHWQNFLQGSARTTAAQCAFGASRTRCKASFPQLHTRPPEGIDALDAVELRKGIEGIDGVR